VLHCDPHPGNLLRTTDGKLCILDWGMVLEVPSELQLSLLEFIAHLSAEDYEKVPDDLVRLDFIPSRYGAEQLRASGVTSSIAYLLRQAAQGGGPKGIQRRVIQEARDKYGIDIPADELRARMRSDMRASMVADAAQRAGITSTTAEVTKQFEQLQRENNFFQIPSYFV
jgi:predicted unusual protein kinase regulating ubiquinone biosynthesis (AarF/ABC1/UbiB family)